MPPPAPADPANGTKPAKPRATLWPPEADAQIRAQYGRVLAKDLARELGCSVLTLRARAVALGVAVKSRPRSPHERRERDFMQQVVAPLLACWPLSRERIAHAIGTGERDLTAALAQGHPLPPPSQRKLVTLLGLNQRLGDAGPLPGPRCSYALLANDDPAIVAQVYQWLAQGESPAIACELVPTAASLADRDWRLLMISQRIAFRPQLIVFPRGGPSAGLLDATTLPGYTGVLVVDPATYRLMLRTWEEVMRSPQLVNRVFPRPVARGIHAQLLALPDAPLRGILQDLVRIGW